MSFGNLNLGNLSSALSMTGADPDFVERLRQEHAARQLAAERTEPGRFDQYSDEQLSDPKFVDKLLGSSKASPQHVQFPAEVQRALERTGSDYRLPVQLPETEINPSPEVQRELGLRQPAQPAPNPYADPLEPALASGGPGRVLPPKAAAALANYRENYHPENATGRDTGINVQSKRHPELSNAETVPYDQRVADLGGGDLGVQEGRLTLARDAGVGNQTPALPAGTDQALARVKQNLSFQLPEGTDEALAKLSGRPRTQLAAPLRINEEDGVGRLQQLSAQNARDQVDVERQRGELGAELGQQRRALYQDDAVSGAIRTDEALQRRNEALARKDENAKTAYTALHAMQADLGNPPDTSKGRVLQIIGMVLSANKRTEGVGKGLAMLGSMMGDDVNKWSQGIESNEKIYRSFQEMNRHEDASMESELRQESQISTLVAANTLNSIRAAEQDVGSEDAKLVARQLGNKVQEQWLNHQTDLKLRLAAVEKEQGDKNEAVNITQLLANVPEAERPALAARIGPRAIDLLSKMQKNDADLADIGKKRADAKEGPKLSDKERLLQRQAEGVKPAYEAMRKYAQEIAEGKAHVPYIGIGPNASKMLASEDTQGINSHLLQLSDPLMRDDSGAVINSDEQGKKWDSWGMLSPDQAVRDRAVGKMLAEYEGRMARIPGALESGQRGAAAPSASRGGAVEMVNPETGEKRMVSPSLVEDYAAHGFQTASSGAQAAR